ncbi:MAG: hypothetical protein E7374_01790 [Clostridiales bacterium]|nr:hypothetical protein [Clostridiales bacterium]
MAKNIGNKSILVTSAICLLLLLLVPFITVTNSWFTFTGDRLQLSTVKIGAFNIKVYVDNYDVSNGGDFDLESSLIVIPDEEIPLELKVNNKDVSDVANGGENTIYYRFKFEMLDNLTNTSIPVTISGNENVVKNDLDGYYYYQNAGVNVGLPYNQDVILFDHFKLDYADAFDGDTPKYNGTNVKFKLVLQTSTDINFINE